jgi:hypothetical protein
MLSTVTTAMPTAVDNSTVPGERKNATAMISSSTMPAKLAVRPAVLAAIEAACLGT